VNYGNAIKMDCIMLPVKKNYLNRLLLIITLYLLLHAVHCDTGMGNLKHEAPKS
jgi:hypothetical protein